MFAGIMTFPRQRRNRGRVLLRGQWWHHTPCRGSIGRVFLWRQGREGSAVLLWSSGGIGEGELGACVSTLGSGSGMRRRAVLLRREWWVDSRGFLSLEASILRRTLHPPPRGQRGRGTRSGHGLVSSGCGFPR